MTMPRYCKTCGTKHGPPTGKGCTNVANNSSTPDQSAGDSALNKVLAELQNINTRLDKLENPPTNLPDEIMFRQRTGALPEGVFSHKKVIAFTMLIMYCRLVKLRSVVIKVIIAKLVFC